MPSHVPNPDRSPTVQVNIKNLIDDGQCYQTVRELRWPDGIKCPSCASTQVIKRGFDETEFARQRYECTACHIRFDDLTYTIFAGHHQSVNHGRGEFARDEDGDGFCEVHVHTMEGFWSLLRSWLRPHRGISQEKLPLYLGFFEFIHNVRKRGKALLPALIE